MLLTSWIPHLRPRADDASCSSAGGQLSQNRTTLPSLLLTMCPMTKLRLVLILILAGSLAALGFLRYRDHLDLVQSREGARKRVAAPPLDASMNCTSSSALARCGYPSP